MVYNVILNAPEFPITEDWRWESDVQTSFNGSETSEPLLRYPKRTFSGVIEFDTTASVRRQLALMFQSYQNLFYFPLYQYGVKLKSALLLGDDVASVNALRGDFRVGGYALLIEGDSHEVVTIESVTASEITFTTTVASNYSKRAILCPLVLVYAAGSASVTRRNPDSSARVDFKFSEYSTWVPFVDALNTETLTTFDGLKVLEQVPFGGSFESQLLTGLQVDDYLSVPALLSPWAQSKLSYSVQFLCNRVLNLDSWHWWMAFADFVRGSNGIFLLPTNREDFTVVIPVAGSGNLVTVEGHEYADHYWGLDTFARVAIESDAGTHYAKVTSVTAVGANDRLTLNPALPAGAGWDQNQKISFMLKVRIADDRITCSHKGFQTEIGMLIRTVS